MIDRLQKKCVVGSALLHGLLVCVVVFGAAFGKSSEKNTVQPITLVRLDGLVTDKQTSGGGEPKPQAAPQPAPAPTPPPQAQPEQPTPPQVRVPNPPKLKVKPPPEPEPEKPAKVDKTPLPMVNNKDNDITVKDEPKKDPVKPHEVKVNLDKVIDTAKKRREVAAKQREEQRRQDEAEEQARQDRLTSIRNAIRSTGERTASVVATSGAKATAVDLPGGAGSGPAMSNYRDLVYTYYFRAWNAPEEVISSEATVEARVVVSRDGTIVSATVSKRSGNQALDRSVEKALRKVNHLPEFPKETSDSERTFRIIFDLESKRILG